jgi:hypothetical protein
MESPNTEMTVWDSGQLIAMGILITVLMNMLTAAWERKKRDAKKEIEDGAYKPLMPRDRSQTIRTPRSMAMGRIDPSTRRE